MAEWGETKGTMSIPTSNTNYKAALSERRVHALCSYTGLLLVFSPDQRLSEKPAPLQERAECVMYRVLGQKPFLPISPVKTQQSSCKQPIPSVFFSIPFYMKREGEVWSSTAQLRWFYSKHPPLRNFEASESPQFLLEFICRMYQVGGENCLSQVFYYWPILYRKTDPRYPSLRRGDEKLRKCQNQ